MRPAYDIYAKELWGLGHGHPLWGPEPDPHYGEVRLGDVGYLSNGYFSFLFNSMRRADDPVNAECGVPANFQMFQPFSAPRIRPNAITQNQLHSRSVRSLTVSAEVSAG